MNCTIKNIFKNFGTTLFSLVILKNQTNLNIYTEDIVIVICHIYMHSVHVHTSAVHVQCLLDLKKNQNKNKTTNAYTGMYIF